MNRTFTCIMCPRGCRINVSGEEAALHASGNHCKKGEEYVLQEIRAPKRNIASSVQVTDGEEKLASVKLSEPIPKELIFQAMEEIRKITVPAPVQIGDVVLEQILGLQSSVVITRNVERKQA